MYMYACIFLPGTSLGDDDVIILAPPIILFSVIEGDTVSLPCVGSRRAAPNFLLNGMVQASGPYSLDFAPISVSDGGIYFCQVGATVAPGVNVTVTGTCKYK